MKLNLFALLLFFSVQAFAWGKQGHAIINQTAALVLADSEDQEFLREHAFDLSYFANVPDIVWKQEKNYAVEAPQHFMDFEIFDRVLKIKTKSPDEKLDEAFFLEREEFDSKYPKITTKNGRSWWRIREIYGLLAKQSQYLADKKMTVKERHELQAQWLVLAGVLGHYVGDLSQPLHLTENYDGQHTSQKGVHSYFEDKMVDLLIPKLGNDVFVATKKLWPAFSKKNKDRSTLSLISGISDFSRGNLKAILEMDRKLKRKKHLANADAYHKLIVDQMTQGALTLAELWSRNLSWKFSGKDFYMFTATPEYILPGSSQSAHIEEIKEEK